MPRWRSSGALSICVEGRHLVECRELVVQHLGDRRGQRGLAVVDVTDGADVDVRLGPLELRLATGAPPVCRHAVAWRFVLRLLVCRRFDPACFDQTIPR